MGGWLGNDARGADRVEMVMFHKHSRTLFVTDHVLVNSSSAKSAQESADAVVLKLSANTGGFSMKDAAEWVSPWHSSQALSTHPSLKFYLSLFLPFSPSPLLPFSLCPSQSPLRRTSRHS